MQGLKPVMRAGGVVATDISIERGDEFSVKQGEDNHQIARHKEYEPQHFFHETLALSLAKTVVTSRWRSSQLASAAAGSARITMSALVRSRTSHAIARSCLRTRLRVGAFPTALEVTKPKRERPRSEMAAYATTSDEVCFVPRRMIRRKSVGKANRCARSSTADTKRRVRCGPYGDVQPRWRGRRGYACEGGNRAP